MSGAGTAPGPRGRAACASQTDGALLVVGAGAAGMACALAAARGGAEVLLVERAADIGGTVAGALIHTIGGLFDDAGEPVNAGLPMELVERLTAADPRTTQRRIGRTRVLNVDPGVYREVTRRWLVEVARITCLTDSEVIAVEQLGGRVGQVRLRIGAGERSLHPYAIVDASGDAGVVRLVDPALVEPGAALAGLVVVLTGVTPGALAFPRGVALIQRIRAAIAAGELPAECATLWPDSGIAADEVYLKLNLSTADFDGERMRGTLAQLLDWLRRLPEFADAGLGRVGQLGVRDGGRVYGRYRLQETDLKSARRFEDAVCAGCWPIEHWHPEQGIKLEYLPPGTRYDIPVRALTVVGIDGLYATGKCLSAEPRAQASARVAGTCWGMGAGLGALLAGDRP